MRSQSKTVILRPRGNRLKKRFRRARKSIEESTPSKQIERLKTNAVVISQDQYDKLMNGGDSSFGLSVSNADSSFPKRRSEQIIEKITELSQELARVKEKEEREDRERYIQLRQQGYNPSWPGNR